MNKYFTKHKWHLVIFACLMFIVAVSGYFAFRTPDSNPPAGEVGTQTPQDNIQNTDNKIQGDTSTENNSEVTSYKSPLGMSSGRMQVTSPTTTPPSTTTTNNGDTTSTTSLTQYTNPITLKVNNEEYTTELIEGMTVYEMMQTLSADSKKPFIFETKEYSGMGHFIESINGVNNDKKTGKYWIYYINDKPATSGISTYIVQPGDKIEWKFETSNF